MSLLSRITVKDFTDVLAGSGSGNFLVFVCTNSICYRADDVVYGAAVHAHCDRWRSTRSLSGDQSIKTAINVVDRN